VNLKEYISRSLASLKCIYSSIHFSDDVILAVHCKLSFRYPPPRKSLRASYLVLPVLFKFFCLDLVRAMAYSTSTHNSPESLWLKFLWEYNETLHHLFIDFKKAYYSVRKEVMYSALIEFGKPMKLGWLRCL
jgi:hypothetical protein